MKRIDADVTVIGAGTAGLAAYQAARRAGARTVMVEGAQYGTTCARVGCMPSKLLIAAADAAHAVSRAPQFGIGVDGRDCVDGAAVMERVRRERDRFVMAVLHQMRDIPDRDRIVGHAKFISDHTIAVDTHTHITSRSVVIATGSRTSIPASFTGLGAGLITSDNVFDWHSLPRSVAVIGTGIIALELGQALHRLGVHVVALGRGGSIGPISDPEILAYAQATFAAEFTLEPDAKISSLRRQGDGVTIVRTTPNGAQLAQSFDYVLAATGRSPNVTDIGIDQTTLTLDEKRLPLTDAATMLAASTDGNAGIFIAGDASGHIALLHEASDEGRIAGKNAARMASGQPIVTTPRRAPLGIVFTDPQIGIVGGGYRALKAGTFATGQASFEDQGRARILLRNRGLLNVYGDRGTGQFLGAEMLAPAAEHLAHLLAWALQSEMTVDQMLRMPFYHPVFEEGLRTALKQLERELRNARGETPLQADQTG